MIKVLQNWEEIGQCVRKLCRENLPTHQSPEKNWDFYQIYEVAKDLAPTADMIDLGCAGSNILKLLSAMGYTNLRGIDLTVPIMDRLRQGIRMWRNHSLRRPYRISRQDMTKTRFDDESFDLAVCVSVIEHGVDCDRFLAEASRILKPGGRLLVTTDYWEEKIPVDSSIRDFKLPWMIFSRAEITELIQKAKTYSLQLWEESEIPDCGNRCAVWNQKEYTFLCVVFRKDGVS